jgi:catechol 2,3-dioxygenase-like lactoylglutathione lyase family enzyme
MTGNTIQITPFMHVRDLGAALDFLVDVLGFSVPLRADNYAYVERDGAGIRVLENDCDQELGVPHRGFAYYIDVHDLTVVQAQIGAALKALPAADVHGPVDQAYGQRELMIRAPDGNLIVFGQTIGA